MVWFYDFGMLLPYSALGSQVLGITGLCHCAQLCKCSLLSSILFNYLRPFFIYCVCACVHIHTPQCIVEDRGLFPGELVLSILWVLGIGLGCQAWWQSPLPACASHQHRLSYLFTVVVGIESRVLCVLRKSTMLHPSSSLGNWSGLQESCPTSTLSFLLSSLPFCFVVLVMLGFCLFQKYHMSYMLCPKKDWCHQSVWGSSEEVTT